MRSEYCQCGPIRGQHLGHVTCLGQSEASCDDLPEVKLVEELGDEDVHLQHVGYIFSLNVPEKQSSYLFILVIEL